MLVTTLLFLGLFHTGLIWLVQVVHYPIFARVSAADWTAFHDFHTNRISLIVIPTMLLELGGTLWHGVLLFSEPEAARFGVFMVAHACVIGVWASTFLIQVPLHNRLAQGPDADIVARLVNTNWIRTVLWTLRGLLLSWIVAGS